MYVKFTDENQAKAARKVLQAYHDAHPSGPKWVDCMIEVGGAYYLTLRDGDVIDLGGEVVESIDPPKEEEDGPG